MLGRVSRSDPLSRQKRQRELPNRVRCDNKESVWQTAYGTLNICLYRKMEKENGDRHVALCLRAHACCIPTKKAQMMNKGFRNARCYRSRRKVLLGREVQVVANLKADLFFIDLVSSFSLVVCHTSSHFINNRLLSHILFLLFLLYFRTFVVHSSNNVILCSPPLGSIFSSTKYIKLF